MERSEQQSAADAVSEVLGGHGISRQRKLLALRPSTTALPGPGITRYMPSAIGHAPFVSARQQLQASVPPSSARTNPSDGNRSGAQSPPRHTTLTIDDESSPSGLVAAPQAVPPRFRGSPLSIDTTNGQQRKESFHGPRLSPPLVQPGSGGRQLAPATSGSRSDRKGLPASGGQRATPTLSPPPPTKLLSSVLLRRKPPPRPPSPSHETPLGVAPPTAPHVLFFQDTDSETSSQHPRHNDSDDSGDRTSHGTTESSTDERQSGKASPSKDHHNRRQASHVHLPGIEKLGELSREEEAYDFAILLKPSKFEEHAELVVSTIAHGEQNATEATALHRAASNVHSIATSATGADEAQANGVAAEAPCKLPGTPRSNLRKQKKDPASARAQIIERITRTGLQAKRLLSLDGKQTLLKVRAPQHVLEMGAERLRLRKLRRFDQIWMEFACELRETFADFDATRGGVQFLDSEKQSIVFALLTSDVAQGGAGLNEFCPLKSKHVLKMFPLHKHEDLAALRLHWVTYWREASTCGMRAKRLVGFALQQPVDEVAQYYGERIAYYFAWIEMYTRWLVVPSVAGVLLFALQLRAKTLDHPLASGYAIFMALWTSAFLLAWKRRAAALAYRWGTLGYEEAEQTRPEFYGDPGVSTETVKRYPAWKRYAKYAVTVTVVVACIALVLVLTFYAFVTRDRLEAQSIAVKAEATNLAKDIAGDLEHGLTMANFKRLTSLGMDWDFWFYFLITPILYGLLIPVLDYVFTAFARRMTNWENHQTESHYQSHLILKVFSFRFVHVFASLYYYAFKNAGSDASGSSLLRVAVQLASFMVSDQLWRNVMQTLYPFVMRRLHVQRKKKATNAQFHQSTVFNSTSLRARHGSQAHHAAATSNAVIHEQCVRLEQASDHAWEEAELDEYDTFEDYTEMLIQFGYVTFFSLAFPLAPLLALINNVFEMRMDAFKLCHTKQRPRAQKASGIGVWLHVLQLMSVLAVLTNCLHIAFTTTLIERLFPHVTATHKVWLVFGVEHLILALKVWMMVVIPSTPSDVKDKVRREREHAKIESARAMAAKIQSQQLQAEQQRSSELSPAPSGDDAGLRRRSHAASSGTEANVDGLRVAQAVLEA